jgi:hypothetical protein
MDAAITSATPAVRREPVCRELVHRELVRKKLAELARVHPANSLHPPDPSA